MIKVRFAPSPTGFLHIGGARTALFNWMYARAQGGKFVLRIEDTDQQRSKKEYEDEILDSMKWLGFDWDELHYQSKRFDVYKEYAQKLVDEGKAYRDGQAVLLKMTKENIKIYDIIRGEIDFDTSNFIERDDNNQPVLDSAGEPKLRDEVLIKSDGSPAYSFCCAVDDALMEITCVCRGEDHISNTPKQILIYNALGFKPPKFAHMPLIMGEDGSRLSKRFGAVAVSDYRKQGYVADALVNYLMLLGWSPGNNQEIISLDQAVKKFSIKKVNKAAAVFSMDKLNWVNNQHLKQMDVGVVTDLLIPFLKDKNYISDNFDRQRLENIVNLFKGRMTTLIDFLDWADFAFIEKPVILDEDRNQYLSIDKKEKFDALAERFSQVEPFTEQEIEASYKNYMQEIGIKPAELIHSLRVALTGKTIGPSLFQIISILGKDTTVKRLLEAVI